MTTRSPSARNARLVTGGPIYLPGALRAPAADWVLVRDGAIAGAGRGAPAVAEDASTFDLRGRTLAPAFADAHVHLSWLATSLLGPDLSQCESVAAVLETVAAWGGPGRGAGGDWIVGTGFDETGWRDKRLPTRAELDRIEARRPILLQRVCGHVGVANSAAFAYATGGPHTDPDTGRLAEDDLYVLNDQVRPSPAEFAAVLPSVAAQLHRHGITAVHDVSAPEMVAALAGQRDLGLRVTCSVPARYLTGDTTRATTAGGFFAAQGLGDLPLAGTNHRVLGLKLFLDGSLGARTACLRSPYADAPATRGTCLYETSALVELVRAADAAGLQLMVHAIGDAALDQALEVLAPLARSGNPLRHRIEHVEVTPPDLVERLAQSGLWACLQPNFAGRWSQPGGMNEQRLGARLAQCNAYRTLHEAGIPIAFGSDCMPLGPLVGLHGAIAHPLGDERLPPATAWQLYTHASRAIADASGEPADFVVLDRDPFGADGGQPARVEATLRGGSVVWPDRE